MARLRSLLWLIALVALASPSTGAWAATQPAMEHAAMTDCGGHEAPLPEDSPAKDLSKHVAGECCAFMCVGMAVMPADPVPPPIRPSTIRRHAVAPHGLAGHHLAKDPPPPRA